VNRLAIRSLVSVILAALPFVLLFYVESRSIQEVRYTALGTANIVRAVLFGCIMSSIAAAILARRSYQQYGLTVTTILIAALASVFLAWALPFAWGVIGAIFINGDV